MKLIEADALLSSICGCFNVMEAEGIDMTTARAIVISIANHAPAVDAVHVVRCKDCKWHGTTDCPLCEAFDPSPPADWYCPEGKRREADADTP